jgi:uncharacterized damage-inducible protein DinB
MTVELTLATLATIAGTPSALRALVGGLPPEALEAEDAGGWSVRQVLAHLLDSCGRQRGRVVAMLDEDFPTLQNIDEMESLQASGYLERPAGSLLLDLERERREDVARYRALTAAQLARRGRHTAAGEMSVAEMLNHAAYHDLLHLRQAAGILARLAHEGRGPMQVFDPPAE